MAASGTRLAQEALGTALGRRRPALASFSAFSFVPPKREGPPELSYFNRPRKTGDFFTYDAVFRVTEGYDQYLPCCDRKHAKGRGLKIHEELYMPEIPVQVHSHNALQLYQTMQEVLAAPKGIPGVPMSITCSCLVTQLQICVRPKGNGKACSVATSSQYGKRVNQPLDPATREHVRVYSVHAAIYGESSCPAH